MNRTDLDFEKGRLGSGARFGLAGATRQSGHDLHVRPDGVVWDSCIGGKKAKTAVAFDRMFRPEPPVREEAGAPTLPGRVRGVIGNAPVIRQHRLNGLVGFVGGIGGDELALERKPQGLV